MKISYTTEQAPGAIPNGRRIIKVESEEGDSHKNGDEGVVIGSIGPHWYNFRKVIAYFIAWDNDPLTPVGTMDFKIKEKK